MKRDLGATVAACVLRSGAAFLSVGACDSGSMGAGSSASQNALEGDGESCPDDGTALTSYSVMVLRGGATLSFANMRGNLQEGDVVTVLFSVHEGCNHL